MSISKIQRNRKIKEFTDILVKRGIEPNNFELNNMLREYFDNHVMGMPYYSPIKQKPYEESSKDDYNHNFSTFKEDIETAYEANIEANNKAVSIQEYYDTEKSKVFHAIDKIALRVKNLEESLRSNKRIQEYVEVFDSLYNLELYGDESRNIPYTTSFVDLLQKRVYTEKMNSQVNKLLINKGTVSLTGTSAFNGFESQGSLQNILDDTIDDIYIFTGKSKTNNKKTLNVIIDLGILMTFNTVLFRSTSSNDMTFTLSLSEDGNNYYSVYDVNGKDIIEWNFNQKSARYLKISCVKNEADGQSIDTQGLNIYEYYYIFKNVTIAYEVFESQSVVVTKPIEFNNLTNFIKFDAEDMIYGETRINYFIGFDNGTNKIGWDALTNHTEHELFMFEKQHKIANFGTYEDFAQQSALSGLYQVYRLPTGVNINSIKVSPGYNMWSVKRYNRIDGDYDDGFGLLTSDVTEYIKNAQSTQLFMDCEDYRGFEIDSNVLYIFTQYIDSPNTISIYDKFISIADESENDTRSEIRVFLNGYEQQTGTNGLYGFNLHKGVNKIQIAVYSPSSHVVTRHLIHNINFKEITNDVYAFKPMHYTNINMLSKSLEPTYEYYTIKNNTIYVNVDPTPMIRNPQDDMGFMISYYALKPNMQRYFSAQKLRFRIMAILNSKNRNLSPSIINFRITGK